MTLREVHVEDFKSIKRLDITVKGNITCFIGKNESGKSNILEAMSYLDYFKPFEGQTSLLNKGAKRRGKSFPVVKGTFEIDKTRPYAALEDLKKFYSEEGIQLWDYLVSPETRTESLVDFLRWGDTIENIEIRLYQANGGLDFDLFQYIRDDKSKNEVLDHFIAMFLPVIQLFRDEELHIKPATVEELKSPNADFETLRRLLKLGGLDDFDQLLLDDRNQIAAAVNSVSERITDLFRKYYAQDKSIVIRVDYMREKVTLSIRDDTGHFFSIDERSPGFQYFFAFVINKHFLTSGNERSQIFLLDEPAPHLYPHACRDLLKTFEDLASKTQILYTTHNVFLTLRNDLDNLIYTERHTKEGTLIRKNAYKNKFHILRKELGILLNDSFLIGDVNLVVEGDTEHLVLGHLLSSLTRGSKEFDPLEWVNVYNADGVTEIENAVRYLSSLGLSGIVLLDSDEAADRIAIKAGFQELITQHNWSCVRINEVFNDQARRTFEDLFPTKEYVDAYNQHYSTIDCFDKPFETYKSENAITPPIVNELAKHFIGFFDELNRKGKCISKVNVARRLLNDMEKLEEEQRAVILQRPLKLIDLIRHKIKDLNHAN